MRSTPLTIQQLKEDSIGYDIGFWFFDEVVAGEEQRLCIMKRKRDIHDAYQLANASTKQVIKTADSLEHIVDAYNDYVEHPTKYLSTPVEKRPLASVK